MSLLWLSQYFLQEHHVEYHNKFTGKYFIILNIYLKFEIVVRSRARIYASTRSQRFTPTSKVNWKRLEQYFEYFLQEHHFETHSRFTEIYFIILNIYLKYKIVVRSRAPVQTSTRAQRFTPTSKVNWKRSEQHFKHFFTRASF